MRYDNIRKDYYFPKNSGDSDVRSVLPFLLFILPGRSGWCLELEQLYHKTTGQEQQSRMLVKKGHSKCCLRTCTNYIGLPSYRIPVS